MTANDARLERPMTIPEVAAMAGWTYDRMKRHLQRLDEELHGMLLKKSAGKNRRNAVTLAALKRACPDMFEDVRLLRVEVDELRAEVGELTTRQEQTAIAVGSLAKTLRGRKAA